MVAVAEDHANGVGSAAYASQGSLLLQVCEPRLPVYVAGPVAAGAGVLAFAAIMNFILPVANAQRHSIAPLVVGVALLAPAGYVGLRVGRAAYRRLRWQWRLWDGRTCWNCGYDLNANASGTCPECGNRYEVELVGTVHEHSQRHERSNS